jgi:hypothetical protein
MVFGDDDSFFACIHCHPKSVFDTCFVRISGSDFFVIFPLSNSLGAIGFYANINRYFFCFTSWRLQLIYHDTKKSLNKPWLKFRRTNFINFILLFTIESSAGACICQRLFVTVSYALLLKKQAALAGNKRL